MPDRLTADDPIPEELKGDIARFIRESDVPLDARAWVTGAFLVGYGLGVQRTVRRFEDRVRGAHAD